MPAAYLTRANDRAEKAAKRIDAPSDLWPFQYSWVWKVEPIGTKAGVGVCIRTTETALGARESPLLTGSPQLPPDGKDRDDGWHFLRDPRTAGYVTCQLIDLRDLGLGDAVIKQPLRLVVRFRVAGITSGIAGNESILEGESIVGTSEVEPRWVDDTLHLLTVYTRTKDRLFAHHVFVRQKDRK